MAKKEEESKPSLKDQLSILEKKYGKNAITNFKNPNLEKYDVIPSGSIQIDEVALGIGGFAKGRMYLIKGWEGSNKSTLCAHIASECQNLGGVVVYLDAEHAIDVKYFKQLGVKFDDTQFIHIQPDNAEMGMDMLLKLMETGEIDLVIIDSDSALLPKSMMEAEPGTQTIGKKAKFNSENYTKFKLALNKHNVCGIVIAQYRVDPGKMFGDNRVIPGGFALVYWADCIIELTKRLKKEGDETSGTETDFKTSKNKTFSPYKKITFDTIFGVGIDKIGEILTLGKDLGIWKLRAGVVTFEEEKIEEETFREMLGDKDFYTKIYNKITEELKKQCGG